MSVSPKKARKRVLAPTEDLEDGEISEVRGSETGLDRFTDGFDEELMGDAQDRARLQSLNELEREQELYQRCLRREDLRRKWDVQWQLARDRLARGQNEDAGWKERSQIRRLNLDHQRAGNKRADAFERLMALRNNRMIKDKWSGDCEEHGESVKDVSAQKSNKVKLKATDIYSDDSSTSSASEDTPQKEPSASEQSQVSIREQLSRVVLTRNQLESFLDKPIFEKTVVDCFVRVSPGSVAAPLNCIYRIEGLQHDKLEYQLGSKRTNLVLRLRYGSHERLSLMDVVSNKPITAFEFDMWMRTCRRDLQSLPLLSSIAKKQIDIEKASEYSFTEGDIEKMIQTKRETGQKRMSAAYRKVCLIMERDMALGLNDLEKVKQLEKQIQEIDEQPRDQGKCATEQRVQSTCAPRIHRPEPIPSAGLKRTIPDRTPKSEDSKLEQFMRRKYKKSALVSRSRLEAETGELKDLTQDHPSTNLLHSEASTRPKDVEETSELDLHQLHNFKVSINTKALVPLNSIFKNLSTGNI